MKTAVFHVLSLVVAVPVVADTVVPNRPIPAHTVIAPADVSVAGAEVPGSFRHPAEVVGKETRVTLYPGRSIMIGDVGPPALIDRNEVVLIVYRNGPLAIVTDGRALDRAAAGERVRIMNLDSRAIVSGVLREDKTVEVMR